MKKKIFKEESKYDSNIIRNNRYWKIIFKDAIAKELGFENLVIVTTRKKRTGEIAGIDKEFVSNEEFEEKVKTSEITANFEFLGAKYGYRKELLESDKNLVTEVHYNRIYDIKRHARNIFSIYIIPYDVKRAKKELKNRNLSKDAEEARLQEIDEHIKEYSQNEDLRKQFDYEFINDYTEGSKNKLIEIIKQEALKRNSKVTVDII